MTPADLAELLKSTASAVLAEHGLDVSALPQTVTVERSRNPELPSGYIGLLCWRSVVRKYRS